MIDFRYHLVSIIAIFFALAAGIALGAGPLNDDVDDVVSGQVNDLREENQDLRSQLSSLDDQVDFAASYSSATGPELVRGRLNDREVLLVQLPGAEQESLQQTQETIERAGGAVASVLQIKASWSQPESNAVLETLASQLVTSGTTLPDDADGYARGAAVLADALMGDVNQAQRDAVIDAYGEAGLVSVSEPLTSPVRLAVLVTGGSFESDDPDALDRELDAQLTLVSAFGDAGNGTVLAGPYSSVSDGGLIERMRADGSVTQVTSSVDVLNSAPGQVATVLALEEQMDGGVGQYGAAPDVDGPVPTSVLVPVG